MIVVSDASPLNFLIRIRKAYILPALYRRVVIPKGVADEMSNAATPDEVRQWIAAPPPWLTIASVNSIDESLGKRLGRGEREAISLALEIKADHILIDDLAGRHAASERHLHLTGTLTLLAAAHAEALLDLRSTIDDLLSLKFRASDTVIRNVLDSIKKPLP